MSPQGKRELLRAIYGRYRQASRGHKTTMLNEFCASTGYHRKYAIQLLNRGPWAGARRRRQRATKYGSEAVGVLEAIWEAAGRPWSVRLRAMLALWLPWAKKRIAISAEAEQQLMGMSARTIDRKLHSKRMRLRRRLYGRTKPGTLLKHHIAIRAEGWQADAPGFVEVDLVAHSGNCAAGDFIYSLNLTDIWSGWVETRAVMGKGQQGVLEALKEISRSVPFVLRGIDSDNGSEFINHHLYEYCQQHRLEFTRSRPYKKDDNAHIEQKNWTHVRKLLGWDRYDSQEALAAMNELYRGELRLLTNLFQASVKLVRKERVGSRLKRVYDTAQTPLDRVLRATGKPPRRVAQLAALRNRTDPFELSRTIECKLQRIFALANTSRSPR